MTYSQFFVTSCWNFLLLVATMTTIGCGTNDQPAANDQPKSADAAVGPRNLPKLDVKQLLQEVPKSFPDDAYVDFPAAGVRMVPPQSFASAERFHGFVDAFSSSSVMITMAPVSFTEIAKDYVLNVGKDPRLAAESNYSQMLEIDGQDAAYSYFVQESEAGLSAKHLLAFGDENKSWFVTGVYPQDRQADFAKEVLNSMMSVKPIADFVFLEPGSDVDFTVSSASLQVTPGWTKAIVFTKDGVYPLKDPTNPCFKAAPSVEEVQVAPEDRAKFALQKILPSPDINVEHIFIDREITVDGLPGRELMALANDLSTNTPILLYAAVLFDENSFITLHGWAGQFVEEDWGAEFKAITESLKRK